MNMMIGPGKCGLLLVACLDLAATAHGACTGPQNMVAQMRSHPGVQPAVMLGSWYASHQQFGCAADVFRAGLKTAPNSAELHYLLGLSFVASKQPANALPEFEKSVAINPKVPDSHAALASVYDSMGNSEAAEREWRKALQIDPRSERALEGLAGTLLSRHDYASVVQVLQNAPRTEKLSIDLARALGLLNYPDDAEAVLKEALKEHPESIPIQQAMLAVLVKQRRHEDAVRLARSIYEKDPNDIDAQLDLFRLLVLTEHAEEARPLAPKILKARPDDPDVQFLAGLIERSSGNYPGAKSYLEKSVALRPDYINSRYELGNTLVTMKEWTEAREQLQKAIDLGAWQPEAHFLLAKALRGLGENDRAAEEMKKYQQMHTEDEAKLEAIEAVTQGDAALQAGKTPEALAHYREALVLQPNNPNYHYKLGIALNHSGDAASERKELEQAVALDPKLPGPHNALGVLLTQNGDADGAVKQFKAAVDAAPNWTEAWVNLAAELAETSHFSEARKAVERALMLEPENAQARELGDQLAKDPRAQQQQP